MKYKTSLVAVGVLAAATALMVFFVLPNIEEKAPTGTEQASQAGQPATSAKPAEPQTADTKTQPPATSPETAVAKPDGQPAAQACG